MIIKSILFTLILTTFSLLCAERLYANPSKTNPSKTSPSKTTPSKNTQLPLKLDSNWTLCIKPDQQSEAQCKAQESLGEIEQAFEDYNGIASYRTSFSLDSQYQNSALSLYIPHLRDADTVYLNGQLIGQTGQFPPDFEKATLYSRAYSLPNNLLHYGNQPNELVISVYNHARQGGLSSGIPVINTTAAINNQQVSAEGLLMLYVGIMLIIAAVQVFYFAAQPQNRDHLYFSIFCVLEAIYILTYSHLAFTSGIHLNIIFRANIALFGVLTLFFFLFMTNFFRCRIAKWFRWSLIASLVILSVAATFIPIDSIYHIVHILQVISIFVLIPFYLSLFYRAIRDHLPYAKLMAGTLIAFIVAVIFDILVDLQVVPAFMSELEGLVSPIFLIGIFIVLTLILIHKHWLYYRNATYDYLTNCLRRSSFIERLNEELHRIHRSDDTLVLALLDLDDFKYINDKHNHIMGDNILRAVATRTSDALREFDLLGRYGGDEFIIAAQVSDQQDALQLLKRVHNNITQSPIINGEKKAIAVSVTIGGVTADPENPVSAEELIEQADEILIKGKVKQKGRVHI